MTYKEISETKHIKFYKIILIIFFIVEIITSSYIAIFLKMRYTGIGFALSSLLLPLAYYLAIKNKFTLSVNIITQIFPIIFIFLSIIGKLHNEGTSLVYYIAPRFGILVIILLPFLIFGTKDKRKLIFSVGLPFVWFLLFDFFHSIFKLEQNIVFHKTDYPLVVLGSAIFLIISVSIIYFLQNINEEYEATIIAQQSELEKSLKKISDSINYAKLIQQALLQGQDILNKFTSDNFILYLPKDVVSGDFYWIKEYNSKLYLMAADCTGHGVPGAFVSMLGIAFLNEIFISSSSNEILEKVRSKFNKIFPSKDSFTASEILERMRAKLKKIFTSKDNKVKDGMDAALIIIDKEKNTLNYSGARNPLVQIRQNELTEFKATANSIGDNLIEKTFEDVFIDIKKDDKFFIFSDGYMDEMNNERKKISKKQFYDLLLEHSTEDMETMKNKLKEFLDVWIEDSEQIDDILVIGVKI